MALVVSAVACGLDREEAHAGEKLESRSVVLGYSNALLPLPALLSCAAIAVIALWELIRNQPLDLDHESDVE